MVIFPNCKINLGLSVTGKRTDGFHNIETLMYPVNLKDILDIIPSPDNKFKFDCSGLFIPGDTENNLVVKAYFLLKMRYGLPAVHIHLHKIIPPGAGLGGGSTDAAFTIILLNKLFDLGMDEKQMIEHARKLGSDCAFFIRNKPVLAYEKGDLFYDTDIDLNNYKIVIVKPEIHINTAEAYALIKPGKKKKSLKKITGQSISTWQTELINDFENPVFAKYPEISIIKNSLLSMGAEYAAMTGSGAAVFGIFNSRTEIKLQFKNCFVWEG